ncbi:MAG: cysteine synthase A [Deltaproteobacteria bacterium]|nr:cysteine synthase A [Deltaproteobacteria bacterium]
MPVPCQVAHSLLELIGATPIVQLHKLPHSSRDAEVWAKLESLNPGGSVKDRICLSMITAAEEAGRLRPGDTVVEPTSGNTGIGLAVVAAVKGYHLILTMPDTMSEERRSLLAAYGATLMLTPDSKGMHAAIQKAEEILADHPEYFMPQQFSNPANPAAHRLTTASEILQQMPSVDALVAGVGTGGTITGVGEVLRENFPDLQIFAVEPASSPILSGGEAGYHNIQGIGAGFVPTVLNTTVYDEVITVTDEEATLYTRRLAGEEGILVGVSSGAVCAAALQVARRLGKGKSILAIFCDTGERYLTTDLFQAEGI